MSKDITVPNPPAFPQTGILINSEQGMTLRDYFAGITLATFKVGQLAGYYEAYATSAYQMADEMLIARTKKK